MTNSLTTERKPVIYWATNHLLARIYFIHTRNGEIESIIYISIFGTRGKHASCSLGKTVLKWFIFFER